MAQLDLSQYYFVTPAKAGVHHRKDKFRGRVMDSRLRGNDELWRIGNCGFFGGCG
jgi:hypothetical protein